MNKYKGVYLRIVGYLNLPENMNKFLHENRIEILPMQNYLNLQKKIAECDINLIPLVINDMTNCKSEIKYFEASVVNTVSIASPTYIYSQIIQDGKNGFLANPGKWAENINNIIENGVDENIVDAARQLCVENYYGKVISAKLTKVFK
jgi:glycosyltransferase involved in cell wall biosynthesis